MTSKTIRTFIIFIYTIIFSAGTGLATVTHVPTGVNLSADFNSITVNWSGDLTHDDGYYVYWGTSSNNLDQSVKITDKHTRTYTISGLNSGTTYYVAVSSYNNGVESAKSTVASITTTADTTPPAIPTGFWTTPGTNITETTVDLSWNPNTETDLDHYTIYYGTAPGVYDTTLPSPAADGASAAVTGLSSSTRYYFSLSATDTTGNESGKTSELIIDTLPDTLPPDAPAVAVAEMSGQKQVTVTVDTDNAGMVDYAGTRIYYGSTSGSLDQFVDLGAETSYTFSGLPDGSTWYFAATAYDRNGNESVQSAEVSILVEQPTGLLTRSGTFKGGCFIFTISQQ